MAANEVPLIDPGLIDQVYAGDDWEFTFRYGERETEGDPTEYVDLSGWTITSQWRAKDAKSATFQQLVVDMSQAADGYITIRADEAITRAMGQGGVFDIQGRIGERDITFCRGRTSWMLDVTRSV